jgi:hypothetical protein
LLGEVVAFYNGILSTEEGSAGKSNLLRLYPNPAWSTLKLELEVEGISTYLLIDLVGNVLKSGTLDGAVTNEIDVADLPDGVYFVKVEGKYTAMSKSLVIARN